MSATLRNVVRFISIIITSELEATKCIYKLWKYNIMMIFMEIYLINLL